MYLASYLQQPGQLMLVQRIHGNSRRREHLLTVFTLQRLRARDARSLTDEIGAAGQATIDACVERSGGNPLFLVERLRAGGELNVLPTSVHSVVAARHTSLADHDKEAAQVAAALGQRFAIEPLQAILGDAGYDCQGLVDAQIVRVENGGWLFTHALIMEGILESMLRNKRAALHAKAAGVVRRARHLERPGYPTASAAFLEAAQEQMKRLKYPQALDLASESVRLAAEPAVLGPLQELGGQALIALGNTKESFDVYKAAMSVTLDASQRAQLGVQMANALRIAGEFAAGLDALADAETLGVSPQVRTQIGVVRGNIHLLRGEARETEEAHSDSLALAREVGSTELEALALVGMARL